MIIAKICTIFLLTTFLKIIVSISNNAQINENNSEGGSLMLGCIICKEFLNYIDVFYQIGMDKNSVKESIQADYCNELGLFTNICTKTLNAYYDDMWKNSLNANAKSTNEKCQIVGLCPTVAQLDVCSPNAQSKYSTHNKIFINKEKPRGEL